MWEIKLPHPDADPRCKVCGGCGYFTVGSICSGFGGERNRETFVCNCTIIYAMKKSRDAKRKKGKETDWDGIGLE